jgi:hypothetical protein
MIDQGYLGPLEDLLEKEGTFGHRQHVDLAWRYLHLTDQLKAEAWMREAIRHVAFRHGAADKYHETRTIAWIKLVAIHVHRSDAASFDEFIANNSDLLNTQLLDHFYSDEVIQGAIARQNWVEPDVAPLPYSGTLRSV